MHTNSGSALRCLLISLCLRPLKWNNDRNSIMGASVVAQWLRICLPMQGHGFEPWSGKIPHAAEQLSPCATTTESAL